MKVGDHCKRSVVTIGPKSDVYEAARVMRDQHVGFLVVAQQKGGSQIPVGVLTDRDLVVQVLGAGVDASALTVEDVMTRKPVLASDNDDVSELIHGMRTAGVRRAPVVDAGGRLVGIIALDDAYDVITELMCEMCGAVRNELRMEQKAHPATAHSADHMA
jgi:CBS domain-containing protein